MKFLIALPDHTYYLWQMLVQINNFRKLGYEQDIIYVIGITQPQQSYALNRMINNGNFKCKIYVYRDDRVDYSYSPSTTANILKKLFIDYPEYEKESFFYIDPDVIFTKKIKFSDLLNNDIWYLSDTRSYINSKYIKSKGSELFVKMCDVVGIDPKIVEENDENAGGAQCLMKNLTYKYWEKVEKDCIELYRLMKNTEKTYCPEAPIQSWTAEMWSVLWNGWLFGNKTKIIKRFDFSWATDPIEKWEKTNIFHNAGAINEQNGQFLKTKYQTSPFYDKKIQMMKNSYCSQKYVEEIIETKNNFKNILF
jgi:hypothetical protein